MLLTSVLLLLLFIQDTEHNFFCTIWANCDWPYCVSFLLSAILMLSCLSVSVSLSIKPFSQQAYSVQTAGTTTISGESDHSTIISFLKSEQEVLSPAIQAAGSQHGVFFDCLGVQCALSFVLWRDEKEKKKGSIWLFLHYLPTVKVSQR